MNINEIALLAVSLVSLGLAFWSLDTIQQYHKKKELEKSTKFFLTYLSILFPLAGFILTSKLRKNRNN